MYLILAKGIMKNVEDNLISVQIHKEITLLYKDFLEIIEDLRLNNPSISVEQYEHLRKRVLDKGNDKIRNIISFLDFFEFIINKEKVEEAAKQKRQIIKKVVISGPLMIE